MTGLALLSSKAGVLFRHPAATAAHLSRVVWQTDVFAPTES
jgi:hypothetical protein